MPRHYQESEIEFRRDVVDGDVRGVVVWIYGTKTAEEIISEARQVLFLDATWKCVRVDMAAVEP